MYDPPDSFTDPVVALEISLGKLKRAQIEGAPPERLDLLMRYMTECQKMMQPEVPPMGAGEMQPPMPGAMPPGMPGPGMMPAGAPSIGDVNINPNITLPTPQAPGLMG